MEVVSICRGSRAPRKAGKAMDITSTRLDYFQNPNPKISKAHGGMLIWALIVGSSFLVVGLMSEGLPPLLLTAIRFLVAAIAMAPALLRGSSTLPSLSAFGLYTGMGLCQAFFFGTMFWVAHDVSALSMSTLFVAVPLLAFLLGRLFGVENPSWKLPGILLLGALGALCINLSTAPWQEATAHFGKEEMVFFLGCISLGFYPVLSKFGLQHRLLSSRAEVRSFWSLAIGSIFLGVAGSMAESPKGLLEATIADFLALIYLGFFSSGLTFWLMERATSLLTPGSVMSYSYLVPLVSLIAVMNFQIMGELWIPGSIMVILTIYLLQKHFNTLNEDKRP